MDERPPALVLRTTKSTGGGGIGGVDRNRAKATVIDRTVSPITGSAVVLGFQNFDRIEMIGCLLDRGRSEKHDARNIEGGSNMPRARIVCDE